jgi:phage terminase large subunit-like protein
LIADEMLFRCQQLNEPAMGDHRPIFSEDMLRSHTYPKESAPAEGDLYITWDWALSMGKYSDFSVGVVGRVYKELDGSFGLSILKIVFDRWGTSELAYQIPKLSAEWKPKKTLIERSNGAESLMLHINNQSKIFGLDPGFVHWQEVDKDENAKRNRIKMIEVAMKRNRLWFVGGEWIDETYRQFIRYTGEKKNRGRKDDIPDAIAYMVKHFLPSSIDVPTDSDAMKLAEEERIAQARMRALSRAYFGQEYKAPPEPELDAPTYTAGNPWGRLPSDIQTSRTFGSWKNRN